MPYVPSASDGGSRGAGADREPFGGFREVRVVAVDDAGQRVEAGRADAGAGAAVEFEIFGAGVGNASWVSRGARVPARATGGWSFRRIWTSRRGRTRGRSRFCDGAARRGAGVGGGRAAVLQPRRRRAAERAAAGERPRRARGGERAGTWTTRASSGGPVDGGAGALGGAELRGVGAGERIGGGTDGIARRRRWQVAPDAFGGSGIGLRDEPAAGWIGGMLSSVPGSMSRGSGGLHRVPLFDRRRTARGRRDLVRVVNRSAESAEVSIEAFDATDRAYEGCG